jgi:hypothetical protein
MVSVAENASKIKDILHSQGSLNLWEVRAILNESRDSTLQVLLWMASRKEIVYCLKDQELLVTLTAASGEGGRSWATNPRSTAAQNPRSTAAQNPSSGPLEGSSTRSALRPS